MATFWARRKRFRTLECLVIIGLVLSLSNADDTRWHQGCYNLTDIELDQPEDSDTYRDTVDQNLLPVRCSNSCRLQGLEYAAVSQTLGCGCLHNLTDTNLVALEQCNTSCIPVAVDEVVEVAEDEEEDEATPLPCGSLHLYSVYSSRGPYLQAISLRGTPDHVSVGHPLAVQLHFELATSADISLGISEDAAVNDMGVVRVQWWTSGEQRQSGSMVEDRQTKSTAWDVTFQTPGEHRLDVVVFNDISRLKASISVAASIPIPTNVDVEPVDDHLTCTPKGMQPHASSVFLNQSVQFKATANQGNNLTFHWNISDLDSTIATAVKDGCGTDGDCLSSIQNYTFTEIGQYHVTVHVECPVCPTRLENSLLVNVVDRSIQNATLGLQDSSQFVYTPNARVNFLVTIVTASRDHHSFVQMNFGDGSNQTCSIIGEGTGLPGGCTADHKQLMASYGRGCTLQLVIHHAYEAEGTFQVKLRAFNDMSEKAAHLGRAVVIERMLKGPHINQIQKPWAVDTLVNFTVSLLSQSRTMQCHWALLSQNGSGLFPLENLTTAVPKLSYTFNQHGLYLLQFNGSNQVSWVHAELAFKVHQPVEQLNLTYKQGQYLAVGKTAEFMATVSGGSEVEIYWDFSDPNSTSSSNSIAYHALHSIANHTFHVPGSYVVSVFAENRYNRLEQTLPTAIQVQEPVSNLVVHADTPTLLGNATTVVATVSAGDPVEMNAVLQDGNDYSEETTGDTLTVRKIFEDIGTHSMTVTARNDVSELRQVINLEVLDAVPAFNLTTPYPAVASEHALFLAKSEGALVTSRDDLVYTWSVDDVLVSHTKAPVFCHTFQSAGNYTVSVTVHNRVSQTEASELVQVLETSSSPRFDQSAVSSGETTFKLTGLPADVGKVYIMYGDGSNQHSTQPTDGSHRWNHGYKKTGLFEVCASFGPDAEEGNVSGDCSITTVIVVQQPIADLRLQMLQPEAAVPIQRVSKEYTWLVTMSTGSHVVYTWSIDNIAERPVTHDKFTEAFTSPGFFIVRVNASNGLGSQSAELSIQALYPIVDVSVNLPPAIQGDPSYPSSLELKIRGGLELELTVDFGDGSDLVRLSSENGTLDLRNQSANDNEIPTYKCKVQHFFDSAGTYNVSFSVTNLVSNYSERVEAMVEEPISGIVISSSSPRVMLTDEQVIVTVTVAVGNDLTFDWYFGSFGSSQNTLVASTHNSSTATHTFSKTGNFSVRVHIYNPTYERLGKALQVTAELPYKFSVVDPVEGLQMLHFPNKDKPKNAAELMRNSDGRLSTDNITFVVRVTSRSDVKFLFDFGDGTTKPFSSRPRSGAPFMVTHIYTTHGRYQVVVTASNGLSNKTFQLTFNVEEKPSGLSFVGDKKKYHTLYGNNTKFEAAFRYGTNVKFDWDMGDGTKEEDQGPTIDGHMYKEPGRYTVIVLAYNHVGNVSANATVFVQRPLQSVSLTADKIVAAFNTTVKFEAWPQPDDHFIAFSYDWTLQDEAVETTLNETLKQDEPFKTTWDKTLKHVFRTVGKFAVTVTAKNPYGQVTSDPIIVQVVIPIKQVSDLELKSGEEVVGHELLFSVNVFQGSDLTYSWDFGDGQTLEGKKHREKHIFNRTGLFEISVVVSNPLGNSGRRSLKLYVLKQLCKAPKIDLLGSSGRQIPKSRDVRIEAAIMINCSITDKTDYMWKVYNASDGKPIEDHELRDPVFYLPPRYLPYANYTAELEINMTGTIVSHSERTNFSIVPSQLEAVISGGIQRFGSRSEVIIIDGSLSDDPDTAGSDNLSYEWECYELSQPSLSCFHGNGSELLGNGSQVLQIPGNLFKDTTTSFVFNLTVSLEGRAASTTQVHELEDLPLLDLQIECEQCKKGRINSDQKLVLRASHPGYRSEDLVYTWKLYMVMDGQDSLPVDTASCVQADGSTYQNALHPNDTESETNASTPVGPSTSTTATTPTPTPTTTTTSFFGGGGGGGGMFEEGPASGRPAPRPGIPPVEEGNPMDIPEGGRPAGPGIPGLDIPEGVSGDRQFGIPGMEEGEGEGGNRPGNPDTSGPEESQESNGGDSGDPAIDEEEPNKEEKHIVSMLRAELNLQPSWTSTGLGNKALVLLKGMLLQNKTYIVELTASHKTVDIEGSALADFRVNESPALGRCSITSSTPDHEAVEMDTEFHMLCQEWNDQDLPIRYEISYSLDENRPPDLIYQGLNNRVTFKLPAGNGSEHEVKVHIAILDNLGSRTQVCSIPFAVLPKPYDEGDGKTEEETLYGLVDQENSTLQNYMEKGDNRNARLHLQMVGNRLNRLKGSAPPNDWTLRHTIRCTILETLKDMPMRDEYEIQQTTSAVTTGTAKPDELNSTCLVYAAETLEKAGDHLHTLPNPNPELAEGLANTTLQGMSNVLNATVNKVDDMGHSQAKKVVTKATKTVHVVLQAEMSHSVIGEGPVVKQTGALYATAQRYQTSSEVKLQSAQAKFVLPGNIVQRLETEGSGAEVTGSDNSGATTQEDDDAVMERGCMQVHMVCYTHNPFQYSGGAELQVQTQVASLELYDCNGGNTSIAVHDLDESLIRMELEHRAVEPPKFELFRLYKHQMNLHNFTLSEQNRNMALHVEFILRHVKEGRLFPITVMLRAGSPPDPLNYERKWDFEAGQNTLPIFLKPSELKNDVGIYYFGLVDRYFNAGRPRHREVQTREYELHMWWAQCLHWDEAEDRWSGQGCELLQESTFEKAHCRCNHLTSFAGHFSLAPNHLDITDVEEFFNLGRNPVTFSLIACIMTVYIILLVIFIKMDRHDGNKGRIIHLIDNSPKDLQTYIITLETGFRKGAGTSAKVSLVLHGEEGMSETRELISQSNQPTFDRNSRDIFLMTMPDNLGNLLKVQIWHNNAGPIPGWYLSRVTVKDLYSGKTYYFICEKWFAVEEGDGKVEREITVQEGGLGFMRILRSKGTQYFADYHLWFSPVTRPSYSRFTRAERLTCCLNLLMSYMAVNAVWYDLSEKEYRGEFSLLDISWRSLAVGIITSIMVLPANAFIVFLFRRTKVKKAWVGDPPVKQRPPRRDSVTSVASANRLLYQPLVTPSIFDQSILNWPNLQEWAQKMWAKQYQHNAGVLEQSVQQVHTTDAVIVAPPFTAETLHRISMEPVVVQPAEVVAAQDQGRKKAKPKEDKKSPKALEAARLKKKKEMDEAARQREYEKRLLRDLRSTKSNRLFLPRVFRVVAWFLSVVIIGGCGFVTVLYGLSFGRSKSIMWMQSLFFSFIQCVFVTHPILVLVLAVYTAVRYRSDMSIFDHHTDGMLLARKKKKKSPEGADTAPANGDDDEYDLAEGVAARQRARYLRFARPPQEKELIRSRNKTIKEKKACSLINETSIFILSFVLLVIIAFGKDLNSSFYLNQSFKNTFVLTGTPSAFTELGDTEAWWTWMKTDFLDKLYLDSWYGGRPLDNNYVGSSVLIGRVNVRQSRAQPDPCDLPERYKIELCHHNYRRAVAASHRGNATYSVTGGLGGDGGEEIVLLHKDRTRAFQQLSQLQAIDWVDRSTSSVVVEFTVYHASTNLFVSVSLGMEQLAGGGMNTGHSVASSYLYKYTTFWDNFILTCEMLFILVTLLKVRHESMEILQLKLEYVKNLWNCLEVVQCVLSLAFMGCYVYRYVIISETIEELRATYNEEYVDVSFVAFWDEILRSMVGILLFLVILGVLKVLRHHAPFTSLGNVFKQAAPSLLVFGMMFVVLVSAFASLGVALFRSLHRDYRSFPRGLVGVVGLLSREYHAHGLDSGPQGYILGWRIFVSCVLIFGLGSLSAYIIAVLSFHYKVYKVKDNLVFSDKDTLKYYWDRILLKLGLRSREEAPEDDNVLPPEFTMAEIEYQVDEMLFKMNSLTGSSNLPEKPMNDFTDSDTTYPYGEDIITASSSDIQDLYDDRFESRIHKIEGNLFSHESHLAQILQLDAIGLGHDLLVQEKEKQLRNELELEIFRQLQLQRQQHRRVAGVSSDITCPSSLSDPLPSGESSSNYHGSASASASASGSHGSACQDSGGESPRGVEASAQSRGPGRPGRFNIQKPAHRTKRMPLLLPAAEELDENALLAEDLASNSTATISDVTPEQVQLELEEQYAVGSAILQDACSSEPSSSCLDDSIPLDDLQVKGQGHPPKNTSVSADQKTKLGQGNASACSSSSGGAEIRSYLKDKPDLGAIPKDKSQPADLHKVKLELAKVKARGKDYDVLRDTPSGSERESSAQSKPPRTLRKTKSRGKGKGSRHFSPIILDNLAFDNQAYSSDSDHDGDGSTQKHVIPGITHKECWS